MSSDIDIEDMNTWPEAVRERLARGKALALAYQKRRQHIDRLMEKDVWLRVCPPENEYSDDYEDLTNDLEALLRPNRLMGFHCTRFTPREINTVLTTGLTALTPAHVAIRLQNCRDEGLLDLATFADIRSNRYVLESVTDKHGKRSGLVWLCGNRSTLRESAAVSRLFRYWGGEAVYCAYEDDDSFAMILERIGTPCIVRCAIPFERVRQLGSSFAARFVVNAITSEFRNPEPSPHFDLFCEEDIPSSDVREVITAKDPQFEELTKCSNWDRADIPSI